MEIRNSFDVDAPVDHVWNYLLDVKKVVPCMPGAELVETIDDKSWKGKVAIKLGPVSLTFRGTVEIVERDDIAHRLVLKGTGMEQRGKGAASAIVTSTLERVDEKTRVVLLQDITLQGQAAQFGRGMMQDVTATLTDQFANCLQQRMAANGPSASRSGVATSDRETLESEVPSGAVALGDADLASPQRDVPAAGGGDAASQQRDVPAGAKPIGGLRLGAKVLRAAIARFFRRLFKRSNGR